MSKKPQLPQTNAMVLKPAKALPFEPQRASKLGEDRNWRKTAWSYLEDPKFLEGIKKLNLNDPETLEVAQNLLKDTRYMLIFNMRSRALQLRMDFDRYSTIADDEPLDHTATWLSMAIMAYEVVKQREIEHQYDFQPPMRHPLHYEIVVALTFEIVADLASPSDSYLKRRFLGDNGSEDQHRRSGRSRKRKRNAAAQGLGTGSDLQENVDEDQTARGGPVEKPGRGSELAAELEEGCDKQTPRGGDDGNTTLVAGSGKLIDQEATGNSLALEPGTLAAVVENGQGAYLDRSSDGANCH